jgi:hypothetical protein
MYGGVSRAQGSRPVVGASSPSIRASGTVSYDQFLTFPYRSFRRRCGYLAGPAIATFGNRSATSGTISSEKSRTESSFALQAGFDNMTAPWRSLGPKRVPLRRRCRAIPQARVRFHRVGHCDAASSYRGPALPLHPEPDALGRQENRTAEPLCPKHRLIPLSTLLQRFACARLSGRACRNLVPGVSRNAHTPRSFDRSSLRWLVRS